MKVILNEFVDNLGERGDVVDVKPGFARNYLIPKGFAYADTPGNRRVFEAEQQRWEEVELKRRSAAEQAAAQVQNVELVFERRASEETGTLFGSVTSQDIADELQEKGFPVERRKIGLVEPLKEIGSYRVPVRLHREIEVSVPVYVIRPGGSITDVLQAPSSADAEPGDEVSEAATAE